MFLIGNYWYELKHVFCSTVMMTGSFYEFV